MTKTQKIVYYILKGLLTALFLFSAYSKLSGDPMAVAGFTMTGLPVWFMYVIGIGELLGPIGLWVRPVFRYAYEGLFIILAGAIGTTCAFLPGPIVLLPILTAVALGIVVWLHGKKTATPAVV